MKPKAICLFSGGLDSTTALYSARAGGYECIALTLQYGQRHSKEIECSKKIAAQLGLQHFLVPIELPWKGSALLDLSIQMPIGRNEQEMAKEIPMTYVPARNSIFLTFAASCAEACGAGAIYIGANALDYSGYPDCRPEYFGAAETMLRLGTKAGVEGKGIEIKAPLLKMSKKEIVLLGAKLGVPFEKTWSCYQGKARPCGECDSCILRAKGFREAGIPDPLTKGAYEISAHR